MPLPTPRPETSAMFTGLSEFVQRASTEPIYRASSGFDSGGLEPSMVNRDYANQYSPSFGIPIAPKLFSSPKTFSRIRRSLNSVLAAKAYVCGSTFFGKKNFYDEEFDFKKGPLHPADRRKIRFGLKSAVDFIIQLDIENLKTCLIAKDSGVAEFKEFREVTQESQFTADSFFDLMNRTNPEKCRLIFQIIERVVSN